MSKRLVLLAIPCLLLAACVTFADLENSPTDRKLEFSGSYVKVAQCAQFRGLEGKMRTDPIAKKMVIYDSVKFLEDRGITHFAMVFTEVSDGHGLVEFKRQPLGEIDKRLLKRFWAPVEACVKALEASKLG